MFLDKIAPKKFLYRFSLRLGAQVTAIWYMCIFVLLLLGGIILSIDFKGCQQCPEYTAKMAHALCINYTVFNCVMFFLNVWFIWGIKKGKSSVALSWVVVTATWLFQGIVLMIILISLTSGSSKLLAWQLIVSFSVILMCINIYLWFIGYAYYLEIRRGITIET
ncbi:uncharacterized protein LOC113239709 [Hyposmocoma kahamanoa]|uniref:uncharacterized protein LOC113239709 n=1 Tax=Hyposmocoma kahamanoa TaxID=1477025 RepID=UPI000E6D7171|nr:uncharacterized protein LOC113239709 [Hyposmocoma kahamanoa]